MRTLYLMAAERSLFQSLPDDVRDGWDIEEEVLTFDDTPARQTMRLALLRVHDPKLLRLRARVQAASSLEESAEIIQQENLADIDEDDLAQLFFALGPATLTKIMSLMLSQAATDEDVEGITALSLIRHTMLTSYHSTSAS